MVGNAGSGILGCRGRDAESCGGAQERGKKLSLKFQSRKSGISAEIPAWDAPVPSNSLSPGNAGTGNRSKVQRIEPGTRGCKFSKSLLNAASALIIPGAGILCLPGKCLVLGFDTKCLCIPNYPL